ncbi:MAG: hypothetical protein C0598_02140 [Marinilabiliales bacterium]|nr:MAG: hypothetical protein C0598_02140 [Marinilabiliales bacterium]
MDYKELIIKRRSIRNFKEEKVPMGMIEEIISESTLAPSAGNEQPWKFIVINNRKMIDRISEECKKSMLDRIASNPKDYAKKYEKMLSNEAFHIFYHSPAVVFILGDSRVKNLYVDCTLAASYLMMSATSKGLGSCWVNFGREIKNNHLKEELGLLDDYEIVAPIALGFPEKLVGIPKRMNPHIIKIIK